MQPEPFAPQAPEPEQEPQPQSFTTETQAPNNYPNFQAPQQSNSDYNNTQPILVSATPQQEPVTQQPDLTQNITTVPDVAPPAPTPNQQPQAVMQPPIQPPFVPIGGAQAPTQAPTQDPGKTMAIIGFIFAFIGLAVVGLVLSIIAHSKSKKAGFKNGLAVAGIWLNAIGVILFMLIVAFYVSVYTGMQDRAMDSTRQYSARSLLKKVEVYSELNQKYPTYEELLSNTDPSSAIDKKIIPETIVAGASPTDGQIGYETCSNADGVISGVNIYIHTSDGRIVKDSTAGYCALISES